MDRHLPEKNRELADFLRRARSRCDPARAGLPADSRNRRGPGLRREEVALLAGISTGYYTRLEQGTVPSPAVLKGLARALNLDAAGRAHLEDLAGMAGPGNRARPPVRRVRPDRDWLLAAFDRRPVLLLGRSTEVLAANRTARALFADFELVPPGERNYARWIFLAEDARSLFADWEVQARAVLETLRTEIGPQDRGTAALITDLRERSAEFGQWWDERRLHHRAYRAIRLRHPLVGDLTVDCETFT
ncbi:helix-turn-helix domain-containing protein, partial [Amycolatopsis sp. NPDC049253]|uniref:helix-turn-helix domain-containing protein n=1 Tax=Amycolatopsis sp. NPDC049253 TaxID=3155274 RepID=UPI00342F57E1